MAIAEFWEIFQKYQSKLDSKNVIDNLIYDEILERLQEISPGLFFEYSTDFDDNTLIITAEGNRSLFPIVDSIVAQAPEIPRWKVFALRPNEGFPVMAGWEDFTIEIADVYFHSVEREDSGLDLYYIVPGLNEVDKAKCHSALLVASDHGIGERKFAETITGTDLIPLPAGADVSKYIPLTRLESFLIFRKKYLKEK